MHLLFLHQKVLSLGALTWAACGKDTGFTPQFLLEEAQRLAVPADEPFFDVPKALAELEDLWLRRLRPYGTRGYHSQA